MVTKIVISVIIILSVFAFVSGCVEETNVSKTKASPASELQHDNASLKTGSFNATTKIPSANNSSVSQGDTTSIKLEKPPFVE